MEELFCPAMGSMYKNASIAIGAQCGVVLMLCHLVDKKISSYEMPLVGKIKSAHLPLSANLIFQYRHVKLGSGAIGVDPCLFLLSNYILSTTEGHN